MVDEALEEKQNDKVEEKPVKDLKEPDKAFFAPAKFFPAKNLILS